MGRTRICETYYQFCETHGKSVWVNMSACSTSSGDGLYNDIIMTSLTAHHEQDGILHIAGTGITLMKQVCCHKMHWAYTVGLSTHPAGLSLQTSFIVLQHFSLFCTCFVKTVHLYELRMVEIWCFRGVLWVATKVLGREAAEEVSIAPSFI